MSKLVLGCGRSEVTWNIADDHERTLMIHATRPILIGGDEDEAQAARHAEDPSEPTFEELTPVQLGQLSGFVSRMRAQAIALGHVIPSLSARLGRAP